MRSPDVARLRSGEIRLNAPEKEAVHDLYRAEVRSVDGAVGDVLNALDRKGLADRTLVVVVGDHGEEFWEHGGVEHGHSVYEEVIRVPLLMRWRGHLPAGARVDALARITDVAPTILDLLGMSPPGNRDGTSLLPFLRAESPEPRVALIENMLFAEERSGVRTEDYKYVRWQNGKEELYDLRADARESRDVAALDGALDELRRLDTEVGRGGSPTARDSTAPQLDAGTVEALRALGYVN